VLTIQFSQHRSTHSLSQVNGQQSMLCCMCASPQALGTSHHQRPRSQVRSCQVLSGHWSPAAGAGATVHYFCGCCTGSFISSADPHTTHAQQSDNDRVCWSIALCAMLRGTRACAMCGAVGRAALCGLPWQPPPTTLPGGTRLTFCLRPTDIAIDACSDCLPPRRACLRLPRCPAGRPLGCRANRFYYVFLS
jgi:hypothetical protein